MAATVYPYIGPLSPVALRLVSGVEYQLVDALARVMTPAVAPAIRVSGGWEGGLVLESTPTTNQCRYSAPTVAQISVGSAGIRDAAGFGPFATSVQFPAGAAQEYAYAPCAAGVANALISLYVRMDDGAPPVLGYGAGKDFFLVLNGGASSLISGFVVAPVPTWDGVYRVSVLTSITTTGGAYGVKRPTVQTGKGFRVVGYQVEVGAGRTMPSRYKPTLGSLVSEADATYAPSTGRVTLARAITDGATLEAVWA
jgi:hypothetical protein